jgi:hypothetical protein
MTVEEVGGGGGSTAGGGAAGWRGGVKLDARDEDSGRKRLH